MPTNTFSCPNQKNANHVRILPLDTCYVSDMLKINLFTKLDDCKVNKSKLIYDKCGKDLKCKIDDKTMNELKENIKNELKKEKEPDDVKEPDGVKEPDAGNDGYSEGMAFSYHDYDNVLI